MKKIAIALILCLSIVMIVNAQGLRQTISIDGAQSLIPNMFIIPSINNPNQEASMAVDYSPAIVLSYDLSITRRFSLGLSFSYQQMVVHCYDWYDVTNQVTDDWRNDITRTNVAIRPLFHFVNSNRIDMYNGFRLGFTRWSGTTDSYDPSFDPLTCVRIYSNSPFFPNSPIQPSFQVILLGIRAYLSRNIGLNTEFAIGSPYYWSFGLNIRI